MKIICLTGGIGSGKTTLLNWFRKKGFPCFESDSVGRRLLDSSLRKLVIKKFGADVYIDGKLNRKYLAKKVFKDEKSLNDLNKIVHPAVMESFEKFKLKNINAPFIIKETAILFETQGYKKCDTVILITSSQKERIKRIIIRDGIKRSEVLERMKNQISEAKKRELADFVIENVNLEDVYFQAETIIKKLKE